MLGLGTRIKVVRVVGELTPRDAAQKQEINLISNRKELQE